MSTYFQLSIMWLCLASLAIIGGVVLCHMIGKYGREVRKRLNRTQLIAFAFAAIVCTYAAQKSGIVRIENPSPTAQYLVNAGSYIDATNSTVYINFTKHPILPDEASIVIEYQPINETNNVWAVYESSTIGLWKEYGRPPYEFHFDNATNYNWVVYTTWTHGPAVVTNGVWHCNWQLSTNRQHIVMINTEIYLDSLPIISNMASDLEAMLQEKTEEEE